MKLLLILYAFQVRALDFSLLTIMDVTVGVLEKYHTTCLYLLDTTSNPNLKLANMAHVKALKNSRYYIQVAGLSMKTLLDMNGEIKCQENLPLYLILSSDDNVKDYINKFSRKSILPRGRWLMFLCNDMQLDSYFIDIHIPYNCEFTIVQNTSHNTFSLTEVYRHHPLQPLEKHVIGIWLENRLQWTHVSLLERRRNLMGAPIKVSIRNPDEDKIQNKCVGYEEEEFCRKYYAIWNILSRNTNATSEYLICREGTMKIANVSWYCAIGQLITNEAEVGLFSYGITPERILFVNYISNAFPEKVSTFIKKQKASFNKWDHILKPFSRGLWLTLCTSLIVLTIFWSTTWYITVFTNISPRREDYTFNNTWIIVIGCLCQQGQNTTPQAWSCRMILLTAYLTYLILISSYAGIFVSFLAVQTYQVPFTDFQGLLDTGTYDFGTYGAHVYVGTFENARNPAMRKIYEKFLAPNKNVLPEDAEDGIRQVCEGNHYAFAGSEMDLRYFKPPCDVMAIPRAGFYMGSSFLISKSSPYQRLFNHYMENLRRFGILAKINRGQAVKQEDVTIPETQAKMEDLLPILLILVGGTFLSLLCFGAELIYKRSYKFLP